MSIERKENFRLQPCIAMLLLVPWSVSTGDEHDAVDDSGDECFPLRAVRHYQVVDDQHIVVNVSNNRVYLVELRRPVRNLDRTRRIAFQSATSRVCPRISEVLVDGGVLIESIWAISEAERDVFLGEGPDVEALPPETAQIEDLFDVPDEEDKDEEDQ